MNQFTTKAASNYDSCEFESLEEAKQYAESITDSTNNSTTVLDADGEEVAWYRYSPNNGGKTYEAAL